LQGVAVDVHETQWHCCAARCYASQYGAESYARQSFRSIPCPVQQDRPPPWFTDKRHVMSSGVVATRIRAIRQVTEDFLSFISQLADSWLFVKLWLGWTMTPHTQREDERRRQERGVGLAILLEIMFVGQSAGLRSMQTSRSRVLAAGRCMVPRIANKKSGSYSVLPADRSSAPLAAYSRRYAHESNAKEGGPDHNETKVLSDVAAM